MHGSLSKREGSTTGRTWAESDRQMARELPAARNKWANFDMQIRPRNRTARMLRAIASPSTIAGRDKEPLIIRERARETDGQEFTRLNNVQATRRKRNSRNRRESRPEAGRDHTNGPLLDST